MLLCCSTGVQLCIPSDPSKKLNLNRLEQDECINFPHESRDHSKTTLGWSLVIEAVDPTQISRLIIGSGIVMRVLLPRPSILEH